MSQVLVANLVDALLAHGRIAVDTAEAAKLLGVPPGQVRVRMRALVRDGKVFSPARGLWVAIPPEYRTRRVIPAANFLDVMMAHLDRDYYLGWLAAAEIHGAAHQRPQMAQIAVDRLVADRNIERVRLRFHTRVGLARVPRAQLDVPTGRLWVSTPEATALDLAASPRLGGGINNVATVLFELADDGKLNEESTTAAATVFSLAAVRRCGFLLDMLGYGDLAAGMHEIAQASRRIPVDLLSPHAESCGAVDRRWRIRVNTEVEPDL